MSTPGIGVLINLLGGRNEAEVKTYLDAIGKKITALEIDKEAHDDGSLKIGFEDGTGIELWDDGRSCCESRYIDSDDNLKDFEGAIFRGIDLRSSGAKDHEDGYSTVEEMFLLVHTSLGDFTVVTHNIHNGYYGGFYIRVGSLGNPG